MDNDKATKEAIAQQVAHIEKQIALLNAKAKEASPGSISAGLMQDEIAKLRDLVAWLRKPSPYGDQSQNSTYYGLKGGTPGGAKQADDQQAEGQQQAKQADQQAEGQQQAKQAASKMSFDNLKANTSIVEDTLRTIEATNGKIDRLVAAGKKFNAARAKSDLHKVASRVTDIVSSVDLAASWVRDDLAECAKRASDLAALFPADV